MKLDRRLGLFQSTVINMIDMVGIGPFVVMPLVISMMGGPWFLYAWFFGALLSFIDAMIWSELGAAYPEAGGSFNFLREAYGEKNGVFIFYLVGTRFIVSGLLVTLSGIIAFITKASVQKHWPFHGKSERKN
jgi:amino acid transporter